MGRYIHVQNGPSQRVPDDGFYATPEYRDWCRAVFARAKKDSAGRALCENCWRYGKAVPAKVAHHRIPRRERPDLELDVANGVALCAACHNAAHPEKGGHKGHPPLCRRRFQE